jgi:small subunit ribosomal protein S21
VSRKEQESFENLLRRFNRKVQQNGILPVARKKMYFQKSLSKREQREIAIRKRAKKEAKLKQLIRGF